MTDPDLSAGAAAPAEHATASESKALPAEASADESSPKTMPALLGAA